MTVDKQYETRGPDPNWDAGRYGTNMDQGINPGLLELIWKLIGGNVGAVPTPPQAQPMKQPPSMSLKDRMAKYRFPPRPSEDLSGMGY